MSIHKKFALQIYRASKSVDFDSNYNNAMRAFDFININRIYG